MLPFFTDPYPDELIYSAIARYHFYCGNLDCKDTLEELFKSRSVIPSVEIGSHFSILAQQLGTNYSVESLLAKHTIYPYYAPFLSKQRQQDILENVQENGQGLYERLGMTAGSICKKDGLYYCSECANEDIEQYGEPYIHRQHQLQGIDYCAHHELKLKKYSVDLSTQSRFEYIRLDRRLMDLSKLQEVESNEIIAIQVKLAKMAYQLLQVPINRFAREEFNLRYRALFRERNLITVFNRMRQNKLYRSFQSRFPKGFLEKYYSAVDIEDKDNWLKVITRNTKRHVHPFRHLLLLYFLEQDVESFLQVNEDVGPFGSGPWPCLNKTAGHYKKLVIAEVGIKRDYGTTSPVGVFSCSCGFVYARKGPDKAEEDKYRIGHVKAYGDVWNKNLFKLERANLSSQKIAIELGVHLSTVRRYLTIRKELVEPDIETNANLIEQYRAELIEGMKQFSNYNRTQLLMKFRKTYRYLSENDKEWFNANLPAKRKTKPRHIVDWDIRDREYNNRIKLLYAELLTLEKPVRITRSLIGKRLNILANIERRVSKMPRTNKLLNEITESVQDFQIRRCCKIIDLLLEENETVLLWQVSRIGGVNTKYFHKIKPQLEMYIQMKQQMKEKSLEYRLVSS